MLGIILFILKIIGIIVLVVLGLVLLVLLLVFFAPFKYKSSGYKQEEDLKVQALITYLNPLVRILINYPEEYIVRVKVLGFTVYTVKSTKEETKSQVLDVNTSKEHSEEQTDISDADTSKDHVEETLADSTADISSGEKIQTDSSKKPSKKQKHTFDKIRAYASLLAENKDLLLDVLKTVINALKTILPGKCYINFTFGTGQADTTGYIYAVYCALLDFLPAKTEIILEPVWVEKWSSGEYFIKGKIRLIHFLIAIIKIITDSNVRKLYKEIRSV